MPTRLERDPANKMIAGVCAGIASYLAIDVTLVRLFFAVTGVLWGVGVLAYIVLLIVMPVPGSAAPAGDAEQVGRDIGDAVNAATEQVASVLRGDPSGTDHRRATAGWVFVALGVVFLLANSGLLRGIDGRLAWPIVLVAVGVLLLVRRTR